MKLPRFGDITAVLLNIIEKALFSCFSLKIFINSLLKRLLEYSITSVFAVLLFFL